MPAGQSERIVPFSDSIYSCMQHVWFRGVHEPSFASCCRSWKNRWQQLAAMRVCCSSVVRRVSTWIFQMILCAASKNPTSYLVACPRSDLQGSPIIWPGTHIPLVEKLPKPFRAWESDSVGSDRVAQVGLLISKSQVRDGKAGIPSPMSCRPRAKRKVARCARSGSAYYRPCFRCEPALEDGTVMFSHVSL